MKVPIWSSSESDAERREIWEPRIGAQAAECLSMGGVYARRYMTLLLVWVGSCIGLQIARLGLAVGLSCLMWIPILTYARKGIHAQSRSRRLAGIHLELTDKQYKAVPLRAGPEHFDRWLAARGQPRWPARF